MITKMTHGSDKANIYLSYAAPACDIIILKMTQVFCLYGMSEKVKKQRIQ